MQLHVFMFLTWRCCSLLCFFSRYSIRLHPNLIVEISGFICYLCLFTHTGVQHNFHITKKDIRTNSDLQNKAKDWATGIQQNTGVNSGTPEGFAGPTPIGGLVVLLLNHIRSQTDYTISMQLHVFMFLIWRCCSLLCFFSQYSIRLHPNLIVEISGFICYYVTH
jgi:hypothetical protein